MDREFLKTPKKPKGGDHWYRVADIQRRENKLLKELQKRGHKCIHITNGYPMHVSWCNNEPCTK